MALALIASQSGLKNSYALKVKVLSPAKLNLYLNILGRYSRNFNRLESVAERVSLCDEITIIQKSSPGITIVCNRPELAVSDNLCVRAARLLQNSCRLKCGFHIELVKNIPVGAGLGGGSSNCASVLLGINQMLGLGLTKDKLYKLGARLGSDVNFFLSQAPYALMQGRGEKITPFEGGVFKHLLVYPGVHLATKMVYQHTHVKLTKFLSNVKILQYALKRGDSHLAAKVNFNVLENSAVALCQEVKRVKDYFLSFGIEFRVTGSGSALYAFRPDNFDCSVLKRNLPKHWQLFELSTF